MTPDGRFQPTRARGSRVRPQKSREFDSGSGLQARFSLVIIAYLLFASSLAAGTAHVLHNQSRPVVAASPVPATPKYLVLMVLDGARADYFGLTPLPHVDALRALGTQYSNAFDGILEAETPTGHATIATGSRPDRNGILGFDWANDSNRYSLFSPDQMGTVEQILQASKAPTIGSLYKARYPKATVVALSGHKYYAAAPLGGPSADAIMYYEGDPKNRYVPVAVPGHVPPAGVLDAPGLVYPTTHLKDGVEDNLATDLALSAVQKMHPRLLLINYPEFDWPLGHVDGGILNPNKVITDMRSFDADLGRIEESYRRAGILNQTLFVITADHGMMPISRFVPSSLIDNAISKAGTTAPDIATSSADYIWLADATKASAVASNIVAADDPGIQSIYYLTTVGGQPRYQIASGTSLPPSEEQANQYLLSALLNGHEPQVVVFGNEGVSFSDPKSGWKADHGGNSWQSQHVPLILSGPGIRPGVTTDAPAQLDDVAPTVLVDMGVKPADMEGEPLTEALMSSSPGEQRARSAEIKLLQPITQSLSALDQQSKFSG